MFTQVGDCNVYYDVSGEGKPLILVHGTGADANSFEDMIPLLDKHFKVYAYDMRGFGGTIRPGEIPLSDDLWADDLSANSPLLQPSIAVRIVLFSYFFSYSIVEQDCPLGYCAIRRRLLQSM